MVCLVTINQQQYRVICFKMGKALRWVDGREGGRKQLLLVCWKSHDAFLPQISILQHRKKYVVTFPTTQYLEKAMSQNVLLF